MHKYLQDLDSRFSPQVSPRLGNVQRTLSCTGPLVPYYMTASAIAFQLRHLHDSTVILPHIFTKITRIASKTSIQLLYLVDNSKLSGKITKEKQTVKQVHKYIRTAER